MLPIQLVSNPVENRPDRPPTSPCPSRSRHLRRCLALGAAIALTAASALAQPSPRLRPTAEEKAHGYSSRTFLVRIRNNADRAEVVAAESSEGVRSRRALGPRGEVRVLETSGAENILTTIDRLRASGHYDYVEPDYVRTIDATPNDPWFLAGEQWALRNIGQGGGTAGADIHAEDAWEIRSSAAEVIVAVIDSGVRRTHEDLAANLWINPGESGANAGNARDDDGNGYIDDLNGIDSTVATNAAGSGNPSDPLGHGTGVASIIGAVSNNGIGMSGVAWNVKLMAARFLDADGGFLSDEIECIDYAIARKAQLINASFGGYNFSQAELEAFRRARDAGIIIVCSAGNDGENSDLNPHYPSSYLVENVVAVANTTRTDTLASSSSYGSGIVELGAPGSSIFMASSAGDHEYRTSSGTSFSAPMVTGALALLKARFPNDTYRETINRLLRAVDPKPELAGKTATGGRLNLVAALRTTTTRPFNDDFAQRSPIVGESVVARGAAQFSTRETGEPVHAGLAGNGSLWWTWTAPRSGAIAIETTNSAADTLLAVYTGTALSALAPVASNDDQSATLTTSRVTFNAVAGTTYQIAVDCKAAASGLIALRVAYAAGNDDFASAPLVSGRSWSVHAENRTATREVGEPRIRNNPGGHSLWFRWVAPASRRYHVATFSGDFNTMLGIYTGSALNALTEVAAVTTAGDSNVTMNSAATSFTAKAGTTYYFAVDGEVSTSGNLIGEFTLSCIDSEGEFFGDGPLTSPALAPDGTVHLADDYGDVYAVNPDGSLKWKYLMTGYGTWSSPAVAPDGTVYCGDDYNYIHAISAGGARKWRIATQAPILASPAIAPDGTIIVRSEDGRLYALNPDNGSTKWTFRMGFSGNLTYSSPVIAPDGTIYCAGGDSKLYAINPTGTQKWVYATDFIFSSPALGSDGTIYFGVMAPTRRLYALRPDGTVKWDLVVGDGVSSSPVIGGDGTTYFGCNDNKLYAVSPTGEIRWTFDTGSPIRTASPIIASDGSIYIGSTNGKLFCVEANGALRRVYATANEIRTAPLLHNGRLYLASDDCRLYTLDVGQVPASTEWPMHRQNTRRTARAVSPALAIGVQPRAQNAEVGETITFAVGAVGTAPLSYQWLFNGQPIAGATASNYRIDPVGHGNGGQYSARVTDTTGTLTSSAATLTVTTPLIPPSVFTAPLSQTSLAGTDITLSVAVVGTSPMTFQWLRDGAPIPGATSSSLVLGSARPANSGSYAVKITNVAGTVTSSAATITISPVSRISNLSIRSQVGGAAGTLTVGLTIGGANTSGTKPLLLRAIGPTLASFGVTGELTDPQLAILSGANVVTQNDDWAGDSQVSGTSVAVGAFGLASPASKDAALVHSAAPGGYTVRINGAGVGSGVALAEVYDASPADGFIVTTPRLINVSALTQVGTGGDVLIAGFSITGATPKTVLVRGIGPTLAAFGVTNALADPKLELFQSGSATAMSTNDNWNVALNAAQVATAAANVGAFGLATDSKDAVLLVTLPPGAYTAQVSGANGTTGLALIEVYEVP